jgi:predicted transcriptional regulator
LSRSLEDRKNLTIKREKSQSLVVKSLLNTPLRFNELRKKTNLSSRGLTETLKLMKTGNIVEPVIIEDKPKYRLTKEGENMIEKYLYLSLDIDQIRFRDGVHFRDYSTLHHSMSTESLPWGIESDLTIDNEIQSLNLLTPKDVIEIEELVFRKISKNILKKNIDKELQGKMVLGFSIDYSNLIESIKKQSLDYINNISKEEVNLNQKYNDEPESLTKKELKRLDILRKKTYEKIKKLNL